MAGLLAPAVLAPIRTRPRLVSADTLLRRAIVLLAAEHPALTDVQLFDLWVERGDEAFTAAREHLFTSPDSATDSNE